MTGTQSPRPSVLAGPERQVRARSIVELIRHHALDRPDAPALAHDEQCWSFGELWRHALRIADSLAEAGVTEGTRVVLWADRTPAVVARRWP